jgi:ribosomal protein L11 methyltransferase
MYLWRKRADSKWSRQHSEEFASRFGEALAITELPGKKRTLVEVSCPTKGQVIALQHKFGGRIEKLRADWLEQLAKQMRAKPLHIGSRLIVSRSALSNDAPTIVIPAEAAFGTGEHATTALCLRMLERVTRKLDGGWSMLDAGTGSGVLAMAGARFGARRIVAIDNDPRACSIARRNARANRIRNIEFRLGDVLGQKVDGKFDVITANLFSEILIAALPVWSRHVARDGWLILSGILRSQEKAIAVALSRNDFMAKEIRRRGKWIAFLAFRKRKSS